MEINTEEKPNLKFLNRKEDPIDFDLSANGEFENPIRAKSGGGASVYADKLNMYNGSQLDECKEGVSLFSFVQFASLQERQISGNDWYNFKAIENLPNDLKYNIRSDSPIEFKKAPSQETFVSVELNINDVLSIFDPVDVFNLNPVRWDNVKKDLNDGWCFSPWVYFKDGEAQLMDGRHRLIALQKYTELTHIPVVIEEKFVNDVLSYLKDLNSSSLTT